MILGLVSDVHCQHEVLRCAAEEMLAAGADEILFAGDGHNEYRFSNEVAELTAAYSMRFVLGNHEAVLLGRHGQRALAAPHVRQDAVATLREAPYVLRTQVDGKVLTMVHANPWAPDNAYLYADHPLWDRCDELDTDVLVVGHTHVPMTARHGRTLVVNPGSLTFSHDAPGAGTMTYALLDTSTDEVQLVRRPLPG